MANFKEAGVDSDITDKSQVPSAPLQRIILRQACGPLPLQSTHVGNAQHLGKPNVLTQMCTCHHHELSV